MLDIRTAVISKILQTYWSSDKFILAKLTGDAGTRTYYRSSLDSESVVIMDRGEAYGVSSDPFIVLTKYLKKQGIPVPEILSFHNQQGVLLLEDLGDITLQHLVLKNSESVYQLYPKVLNLLVNLHTNCEIDYTAGPAPRFDFEKLRWEMDFFLAHFVEGHKRFSADSSQRSIIDSFLNYLCNFLDQELPMVFTHRDFHARNLMVLNDSVRLIDYQDARSGLPEYDLASILRDAYVQLPENYIESFLAEYYLKTNDKRDPEWRRLVFSFMCIQRNLKALGTFGFQAAQLHNSGYLKYISLLQRHINIELKNAQNFKSKSLTNNNLPDISAFTKVINEILD